MIWKHFVHYWPFRGWIFLTEGQWCDPFMFLWCDPEQTVDQTVELPVIWDAMPFIWCQCNAYDSWFLEHKLAEEALLPYKLEHEIINTSTTKIYYIVIMSIMIHFTILWGSQDISRTTIQSSNTNISDKSSLHCFYAINALQFTDWYINRFVIRLFFRNSVMLKMSFLRKILMVIVQKRKCCHMWSKYL